MFYAPETPAHVFRSAALAGAAHFGQEAVHTVPIAQDRIDQVIVYKVEGRHEKGWQILGESVIVTVADDGSTTIEPDEDEACTSDDPTNHQGDTCPIHEA